MCVCAQLSVCVCVCNSTPATAQRTRAQIFVCYFEEQDAEEGAAQPPTWPEVMGDWCIQAVTPAPRRSLIAPPLDQWFHRRPLTSRTPAKICSAAIFQ